MAERIVWQQFAFTFPDDIDLKSLDEIQVYKGFILTLPFRLRTGVFFTLQVGDSFDVIFRNRLDIPLGTPSDEVQQLMWEGKKFRKREQFFTEALVLDKNQPSTTEILPVLKSLRILAAMKSFNFGRCNRTFLISCMSRPVNTKRNKVSKLASLGLLFT